MPQFSGIFLLLASYIHTHSVQEKDSILIFAQF